MIWPFNKKAAPIEAKAGAIAMPEDWLLETFGAGVAGSPSVSRSVALTVPAVSNAVKVISESVATASLTVKRKVDGEEVDVPDFPALNLLSGASNPWTSGYELIRDLVSQALTNDAGGLAWVNRVGGRPAEIIRYDDGAITVQYSTKGTGEPEYRLAGKKIKTADVIHLRGPFDRCPLSLARDAIGVAKQMELYASSLWQNGAKPGGYIKTKKPVGEEGVRKMLAGWKASFGGAQNAGATAVLWDESEFVQMAMTSVDGEFTASRTFQAQEVARAFGIPQHMIGILDRATWGNYGQAAKEYLTATVLPWMRALESALNRALLTDAERTEYRFAFDLDDFSQGSLQERSSSACSLVMTEILNPNEARDWLGLGPRPGGEVYKNPNTSPGAQPPVNDNTNPGVAA
jgi:HK97 family phage portal protein